MFRLHYFPESGNSYKLALMLALCGQRFEPVWTDFAAGVTRTPEWRRAVNVMGEIPVLEEDGTRSSQTAPILLRLAERFGRFGGHDAAARQEVLRWLFWDQKLSGFMAAYRYRRAFTPEPDPAVQAYLRARTDDCLGIIERLFGEQPFATGDQPTVADLAMTGYLSFPPHERRLRPGGQPPGGARLAGPGRGPAEVAGAVRPDAGTADAVLRVKRCYV